MNMKILKRAGIIIGCIILIIGILWLCLGEKLSILYKSLNSFKDENLAYTFQHTPEIQPTVKISKSNHTFEFVKEENITLADGFHFSGNFYPTDQFMNDTKTSAMLVIKDDVIKYEKYFFGGDEHTVFSSNSMGKSFVSALMGIAVSEGYIESIDDSLGRYIPEFVGTDLENIPIKACLQMASGIDFDEDKDMSNYSIRTLLGMSPMKVVAKYGVKEAPYTYRRYLSINTEILGQVIKNATGQSLAGYMEEKLWKKIGSAHDAYWTLSNDTELAMGGLSITLQDYARFARLYLNDGNYNGEQIIPKDWVRDSFDVSAEYSKPGANQDVYNTIGYGYQWWVPDGSAGEFMAIGVYGQFIYVNPEKNIIIVKTNADPDFMSEGYELKHIEFFRAISNGIQ
ncbi:serine hydrolase domain-containing protein [Lachnoclostridium edouardi]|uniref:serine hydrolase domain-containing protein n=1 Tax=Lachnoclostridium edouardi TaxID=1926283 RepID=UPI0015E0F476|nr:serine hydrolase [Lachnoclostridium edouardi]